VRLEMFNSGAGEGVWERNGEPAPLAFGQTEAGSCVVYPKAACQPASDSTVSRIVANPYSTTFSINRPHLLSLRASPAMRLSPALLTISSGISPIFSNENGNHIQRSDGSTFSSCVDLDYRHCARCGGVRV
jgi:hypothetical protein